MRASEQTKRAALIDAGLSLAREVGWLGITRDETASRAGVSTGLIHRYYGAMPTFREMVMGRAVLAADLELIAQGLAYGSPAAREAPEALRREALASVMGI